MDYDDISNVTANIICRETSGIDAYSIESYNVTNSKELIYRPFVKYTFQCNGEEISLCDCQRVTKTETLNVKMGAIIKCNKPGDLFTD